MRYFKKPNGLEKVLIGVVVGSLITYFVGRFGHYEFVEKVGQNLNTYSTGLILGYSLGRSTNKSNNKKDLNSYIEK